MNAQAEAWSRLPAEMRQARQWCVAGVDKEPLAVSPTGLFNISVTNPSQWMDFDSACRAAYANGLHIGYVLHKDDPFTCIDLDVKDSTNESDPLRWTTPEQFNRFWEMVQAFDSYTETSRSGKGLHIWVRGKVPIGMRKDGVEVYSADRYIISTGKIVLDRPIQPRQELLDIIAREIRGKIQAKAAELVEMEEADPDEVVIDRAINAGNADKFNDLCAGDWEKYGFPSQSEADLALMSIFTFYSQSNEQCRRLFRMSALGKREKSVKDNRYIDYTLKLIRGRQAREENVEADAIKLAAELVAELQGQRTEQTAPALLHVPGPGPLTQAAAPVAAAVALAGPVAAQIASAGDNGLEWPPGMAGAIAGFIYQSAPRPVKEVAIVAALGFLAGVCGKTFTIPQSGLNMYLILVARSAVGKEAMHSGISALIKAAAGRQPAAYNFVDFSDFASGPALAKAVAANPAFVNVAGEWGRKLKRLAMEDGRESPMQALRTVMTNLYQKSGPTAIVGGITYSNKDSNISSVSGVSFSMIGETTPSTFYDSLTDSMMEDGFLSRFTVVEYDGDRPSLNTSPLQEPSKALGDAVADLCTHSLQLLGANNNTKVGRSGRAAEMMWSFEQECDREINSTKDETWRQMWNRASLKVMRVSGLLAVADNWLHPVIESHHVKWALELIRRDISIMQRRMEAGDVGMGDHTRERKVLGIMADYLKEGAPEGYKIPQAMRDNSIIPRKFLQIRAARVNQFVSHKLGATVALDHVIRSLCDSGYIMEVDKSKMVEGYSFHGKCYRILSLPDYSADRKKSGI